MTHHFAHRPGVDCSAEWEPETEWHRWWKSHAPIDRCEVNLGNGARADVLIGDALAIEFQRNALSVPRRYRDAADGWLDEMEAEGLVGWEPAPPGRRYFATDQSLSQGDTDA